MAKKLLVAAKAPFSESASQALKEIAEKGGLEVGIMEGISPGKAKKSQSLDEALAEANALILRSDKLTKEVIDAMPGLELVIRAGAGYDNIDVDYCTEKGITVMNTPGQNSNGVAELVFSMATALLRKTNLLDASTKEGKFEKKRYIGTELRGKKLAIHGFGYVGQRVAEIAGGFGMDVYACDPFVSQAVAKEKGVTMVETPEELYKGAYMVSLHLPELKGSIARVDRKLLSLISGEGMLINTARPRLINEDDLEEIMLERPGFRYGADVHRKEEPGEQRFAKFGERAVLTPHIGAQTREANDNCATAAAKQAVEFFTIGRMDCAVNKDVVPYWMREYAELAQVLGRVNSKLIKGQPMEVRVICYGELEKYQAELAGNVLKGMSERYDITAGEALELAKRNGVNIDLRKPDITKKHGDSITIDYFVTDNNKTETSSVRGTVTEGSLKISRIEEFRDVDIKVEDDIAVLFQYKDREGMADEIGNFFTDSGYSKVSGRFIAGPSGENAIYAFYVQKKQGLEVSEPYKDTLEEIRAVAEEVKRSIHGVYKAVVADLRKG